MNNQNADDWTPAQRIAFRFVFAYFALFLASSLFDSGDGPRRVLSALSMPVVRWVGYTILRLDGSPGVYSDEGGVPWAVAQQLAAFLVAAAIAIVWSLASRRTQYHRLYGWFRIGLRYYVGVVMMVYGGFKIIPTQFPAITLDQMAQPLGALAPMGLLWTYMGHSAMYSTFAGLGESVGAFLLFFRRTTTAGALVLIAVLSNVALLNYLYDVPVKQLSTNLLLAAVVLAAPDARRLIAMLVLNEPVPAASLGMLLSPRARRARRFLKPMVVVVATCAPIVISFFIHQSRAPRSPLFGIYEVDRFIRNGRSSPPLTTDPVRWRRVVFSRPGTMSIQLMSDSMRSLSATVDTARRHIVGKDRGDRVESLLLDYERFGADSIRLRGSLNGDSLDVTLRRLDERKVFRLLR